MRAASTPPVCTCGLISASSRCARPSLAYVPVMFVKSFLTSLKRSVSDRESLSVSSVSRPSIASWLSVPEPTVLPVDRPTRLSWFRSGAEPGEDVARRPREAARGCRLSAGSAFSTPLARSSSVVGFTTFFSLIFELMKSTVELYWSTNAWILPETASVFGPGAADHDGGAPRP